VNGSKVTATVKPNEVDGIESVGLAAIAGLARNKRGRDHVAVKAVLVKDALEDEAGAGGFVTRPHRALLGQAAKETPGLVEIARELNHLWRFDIAVEDGGGNGI
jgi:hypothetical protein